MSRTHRPRGQSQALSGRVQGGGQNGVGGALGWSPAPPTPIPATSARTDTRGVHTPSPALILTKGTLPAVQTLQASSPIEVMGVSIFCHLF